MKEPQGEWCQHGESLVSVFQVSSEGGFLHTRQRKKTPWSWGCILRVCVFHTIFLNKRLGPPGAGQCLCPTKQDWIDFKAACLSKDPPSSATGCCCRLIEFILQCSSGSDAVLDRPRPWRNHSRKQWSFSMIYGVVFLKGFSMCFMTLVTWLSGHICRSWIIGYCKQYTIKTKLQAVIISFREHIV